MALFGVGRLNDFIGLSLLASVDQWVVRASCDTCNTASIIVGLGVVAVDHYGDFVGEEDTSMLRAGADSAFLSFYECEGFFCDCGVRGLESISVSGIATIFLSFLVRGSSSLFKAFGVASIVACLCHLIFSFKIFLNLSEVVCGRRVCC